MARKAETKTSVLLVNPDTPEQRAASVIPTPLLPMLAARAVNRERERDAAAVLVWAHHDTALGTVTREDIQ